MDLDGEMRQRTDQAGLDRKPEDLLRDRGRSRVNCWAVMKWVFEEKDKERENWLGAVNRILSFHFVDALVKIQTIFQYSGSLEWCFFRMCTELR